MSFATCRGETTRKELVLKYDIMPVIRSRVLPGQKKEGCCGLIEDEYYLFSYQSRAILKTMDISIQGGTVWKASSP